MHVPGGEKRHRPRIGPCVREERSTDIRPLYEYGPQYEPPFLYMKSRYIPEDFPY